LAGTTHRLERKIRSVFALSEREFSMEKRTHNHVAALLAATMVLAVFLVPAATRQVTAQSKTQAAAPYDSIATDGETYAGPGREFAQDEIGPTIFIGLLAPMHGPEKAEGAALVAAARMALQDSTQGLLPHGQRIELAVGDESGPAWGHVSDVILQLVLRQNVVALITSTDGTDTHVSEQVGNRIGVPILTLSSDATTTQIDIPWIFRLGPSDAVQAQTIAANIFRDRGLKNVMVISDGDHDGRGGIAALRQAAISMGAPRPEELVLDPLKPDFSSTVARVQDISPQAIVVWTQADFAHGLLPLLRASGVATPVYLSQQAAHADSGLFPATSTENVESAANSTSAWTIASRGQSTSAQESFAARYSRQMGGPPSTAAAEAYDAVCLTVRALRSAGPNRARVRDKLAKVQDFPGMSGTISFDREGNNGTQVHLVAVPRQTPSMATGDGAD
jgi:branched-chain amino acid transport system substrate-binding protein